jgi:thioredoxin 1
MISVTDEASLETAIKATDKPVLLYFTAIWCGPCKVMRPIIEALNPDKVAVVKVDTDQADRTLLHKYEVKSVPCFHLLKHGQSIATRTGLQPRAAFEEFIASGYEGPPK